MTSIRKALPVLSFGPVTPDKAPPDQRDRYAFALRHSAERHSAERQSAERLTAAPTPTENRDLPLRRGGFSCLCEALDYAARGDTGLNFFDARGRLLSSLAYRDLRTEAQVFARRLIAAGVIPGERLVLIADTWPGFCVAFFGAQYAGVLPVPVAVPVGLGAKASYIEQLRGQIVAAGAIGVLAPDELADFARAAAEGTSAWIAGPMSTFEELPERVADLHPLSAGQPCYVQFSSGSTRAPLGVDIRQDQLMANIDASLTAQELNEHDSGVSWLPLYHDMGLIGFVLAPMCAQRSVDLLAPRDFARRPLQWLALISRRRASITYSPSFGYDLVARRAQTQSLAGIDLSSLRIAGVGADMIRPPVLQRFAEAFRPAAFDERAFFPSYGMAEVCVGLSFVRRFAGLRVDTDPVTGRDFVVCGRVIPGHQVEIRDAHGAVLQERQVGRLFVRGPSVMPGYFGKPESSAKVLRGGWLDTGDLGYWRGDELVITGRAKDLIIVNGRNIWPQDIEWAVEALPRLRQGDACAFSVNTGEAEAVIVLVQGLPVEAAGRKEIEGDIRQAVKEAASIECEVVSVSRQTGLPLTSSGKISRARAKATFMAGGYPKPCSNDLDDTKTRP